MSVVTVTMSVVTVTMSVVTATMSVVTATMSGVTAIDVGGLIQERDPHPGRLAPEAEDSGLTSTYDVYFDLPAIGVEFP